MDVEKLKHLIIEFEFQGSKQDLDLAIETTNSLVYTQNGHHI
jgi:hypothetical protein